MLQICRTCLQEIQDSNYFTLTNNTVAIIIKNQLALCVPEMVLDIVSEPVMCYLCVAALHSAFDFKYRCLQSEERIRNYIQNSTMHSNTNGVNLAEMFPSISEAVTYANTVGLTQEAHFENDSDTSLDIKYEIIPIDEDLTKPNIEILGNVYCQPSINEHVPLQTSSRVHQEMCSLEHLCESEELQLQFNCVFMEQPEFAKVTCTEKEFPVVPTNPCNNVSYSLEDWVQFEERYLGFTCFEEASHSKCEEGAHSVSSHTTDHSYARRRIEVVPISEVNQPSAKRPRLIRAAKRKVELQKSPYNPKTTLKRKKIASKKHLKLKKSVRSHKCNATKNILKCSECEYTTQLQMNLELHSISHININNDLESKMKTNSNVQECTTIDSEKRSSVYCCKGYQCLKYDYSTQKTFKSDKCNFNKRNKTSKSDNIEKIPCFKTNHREKLFRNNHIEHHKKDEVEVQSFKGDHNKDKCLIRAHSEDRSAVSDHIDEHQSLESNHNDEGHSDKNNHSEDNQSLIIQSTINNFLTDDHIEINKKEHVKKLKHSTNDSVEEDKLFKSSHNTDGKVHTYAHINPLENNYDQNGKNNFNVTDQFLKNNSNKEKLLENGHIQKDQLFKKHGIEVNQYLNYKNIKENMASKDNTIEVDKSKSANHLEVSQSDKNDCNEKNYSKSGDDTEVKASTADHSMEHQFLKNDKVERNSDSRIDHIKVDKSFECDQIRKNNIVVNNCIEGDKTKSDDVKVDKPFECDNTQNNKNLEDSCNKKDEIIDKCKWSFKNDNVEKVESNYYIKENSTCSSHHTEKEQSFKDDRIHKNKSMCDDHIEDQSTKTNHFVDAESKINSNEWNKSFESDSVEKQQLLKDDNTENKCSEKDQSNSEKDQSYKNCFSEENSCFKSDNTERDSLNTDYIEGDQLFKNIKFGQSLKSDQLDDHSLKSEKGQFPQQIPSEEHKYLKNVKFKNYRVEDCKNNYIINQENGHTEEKHIFKNITEDQSSKHVMKAVQPLKHDLNEPNLSNKDNDIQALFKTKCAKKSECSKNTNKEDNKIYGSDHIAGESGPTQDKKSDYENEYLTTGYQTSKNNYIEQNKSFKTDYRGEKGSVKFHSEEQSITKTEVKSSKNDYGKKFFKGTHIGEFFKNTQSKKRKRSTSDCAGVQLSQSDHSAEKLTSNRIKRKLGSAKTFFKSEVSNEKSSKTNYCMKDTISKCTNSDEIESCGCIKCEFAATLKNDLQEHNLCWRKDIQLKKK